MKNEIKYPITLNEIFKLIDAFPDYNFCIYKQIYDRCEYEGLVAFFMHFKLETIKGFSHELLANDPTPKLETNRDKGKITSKYFAGTIRPLGYDIFKEEEFGDRVTINEVLYQNNPEPWWKTITYNINYDYLTHINILIMRGLDLNMAISTVIESFDADMLKSTLSVADCCDFKLKLISMFKLFDIKSEYWEKFREYSDITFLGYTIEGDLTKNLSIVYHLAPIIRPFILNYKPL
jgi:hypothetical protein